MAEADAASDLGEDEQRLAGLLAIGGGGGGGGSACCGREGREAMALGVVAEAAREVGDTSEVGRLLEVLQRIDALAETDDERLDVRPLLGVVGEERDDGLLVFGAGYGPCIGTPARRLNASASWPAPLAAAAGQRSAAWNSGK